MKDNQYLLQRKNRKKLSLRLRLGVLQLIHHPILNIVWFLVILVALLLIDWKIELLKYVDIHNIEGQVIIYAMNFMNIFLPLVLSLFLLESIGEISARRDESNLMIAFDRNELRNGCPILMNKTKVKGSDVIIREFYSYIPYNSWLEKKDAIADAMNVHFVEEIEYGGKSDGNRILIKTARWRKRIKRDVLYDEEF